MAVRALDPEIPVFDRFAKSYPKHPSGAPATYGKLSEACSTEFQWDAHFAAYACPSVERRLGTPAALASEPKMVLLVLDVDGPDHRCTPEWWALERDKVRALFKKHGRGYCYTTKGGYRVIFGLQDELTLRTPQDAMRWRTSYLEWIAKIQAEFAIVCDENCSDWTRCYRLPRVTRDGVPTVPVEEIGEADRMLGWREPYVSADDPRLQVFIPDTEVVEPAPVAEDDLVAAAHALGDAWPLRNRHYAGLALAGALARAGWSEEAIVDFLAAVFWKANAGDPWYEEAQASARSSVEKVARGEAVAGWDSLAEYLATGPDGQLDDAKREAAGAAVFAARRGLGQPPPIDVFQIVLTKPTVQEQLTAARAGVLPEMVPDAAFQTELAELRAEVKGGAEFDTILDDVASELPAIVDSAESTSKIIDARPMGMTFAELHARNPAPPEFLIEGLIPKEGVGALSGEPKSAKSWDATYYAVCVAAGKMVFQVRPEDPVDPEAPKGFAVQKPARVFYFYAEDTESAVNMRVAAIAKDLGLPLEGPGSEWTKRLVMQPRGRALDVMNTAQLCVLAASVRWKATPDEPFALLILDPLSNIHTGKENERDSIMRVMARLHALEMFLKVAVLFVHHSGKDSADNKGRKRGGQKMRGSSAIHGAVDFGIYLSNLRGNKKNEFIALVESEMKAARGAGMFDRVIKIEDNQKGHAQRAMFAVSAPKEDEKGMPGKLVEQRAREVVERLWQQNGSLTWDELKRKIGGKANILTEAIELAIGEGWVKHKLHGARSQGYEITDKGREYVRDIGTPDDGASGDSGAGASGTDSPSGGGMMALADVISN